MIYLVAALGAVVVIALGLGSPKVFMCAAVVAAIFGRTAAQATGITTFDYLDEGAALLSAVFALAVVVNRGTARGFPGLRWFALFLVAGIVSAFVGGVPFAVAATGTLAAGKGTLLALSIAQLDWTERDLRRVATGGAALMVLVVVAVAANFAAPKPWADVFSNSPELQYRSSIPSMIGPFVHPSDLAAMSALGFLAIAAYAMHVERNMVTRTLGPLVLVASILAFRRKTWFGLAAAYLALRVRLGRAGSAVISGAIVAMVLLFAWGPISGTVNGLAATYLYQDEGPAARTLLTEGSLDVANHYLPFGAGFGRYGSDAAASNYSPEYTARGFQGVYGMSKQTGNDDFLTDTMWPSILGEAGWIGLFAFVLAGAAIFRRAKLLRDSSPSAIHRWVGAVTVAWLVQAVFEALGSAVFVAAPTYLALFFVVGLLGSIPAPEVERGGRDGVVGQAAMRQAEPVE